MINTPQQIQDLVSEVVHAYPAAQIELDPLPSGICFLRVTLNGRNFALEYHPVQGTGVSENTPETTPFDGHANVFSTLSEAVVFYKKLLDKAEQAAPASGPYSRTAYTPVFDLNPINRF